MLGPGCKKVLGFRVNQGLRKFRAFWGSMWRLRVGDGEGEGGVASFGSRENSKNVYVPPM